MSLEKLKTALEMASIRGAMGAQGRKLVFTNGVFDLLHVGHVRYLQQARSLGDALLVALNGDASVRALKGRGRPINPEHDRAEVLAALECVTYVTIFSSVRVTELLTLIRPQIYVKGGDYTLDTLDAGERCAPRGRRQRNPDSPPRAGKIHHLDHWEIGRRRSRASLTIAPPRLPLLRYRAPPARDQESCAGDQDAVRRGFRKTDQ